jgi:anti-anti-sigma factor
MSFHFCSHPWEVKDVDGGTLVKLTARDLDKETVPVLVEDLFELVQESGRPNLYLDLIEVRLIASVVLGKMLSLDTKLRAHGGRLILTSVDPFVYRMFQATRLTDVLDVRKAETVGTIA